MSENRAADEDLPLQAYLYAGGELADAEASAFEQQLAELQAARELLSDAIRLGVSATGATPGPSPAYREAVRRRLKSSWRKRLARTRSLLRHPVLWACAGAAAALLVSLTALRPTPVVEIRETLVIQQPLPSVEDEDDERHDIAFIWAELSTPEHVAKSHSEETRRKSRVEDRRQLRRPLNPASQ